MLNRNKFRQWIALFFVLFVFIVIPFYYQNDYYDMLQAKSAAAHFSLCILLPIAFVLVLLPKHPLEEQISLDTTLCQLDRVVLLFAFEILICCLCSDQIWKAFSGTRGWGVGGFLIIGLIGAYFIVSRWLHYSQNIWLPILMSNAIIFMIGILHSAGIDALSLHEGIMPDLYYLYISTTGNLNWYAGYLTLLVPVIVCFYLLADEVYSERIYLTFLVLAFFNIVLCASDGLYLGLGVCAFFAFPFIFANWKRTEKIGLLLMLFGIVLLIVHYLPIFQDKIEMMGGISKSILHPVIAISIFLVGSAFKIGNVLHEQKKHKNRSLYWLCWIFELGLIIVSVTFLINTILTFNDSWGTERGLIWRSSLEIYGNFSWKDKLIGIGPELLIDYYTELSIYFSRILISAHSEPLQILLTSGLLGLLCWCGIWGVIFESYFQKKIWKSDSFPFFLSLAAYFGQSLVNGPQAMNVCILCVIMALFRKMEWEQKSNSSV